MVLIWECPLALRKSSVRGIFPNTYAKYYSSTYSQSAAATRKIDVNIAIREYCGNSQTIVKRGDHNTETHYLLSQLGSYI